jgi:hypothetical protein
VRRPSVSLSFAIESSPAPGAGARSLTTPANQNDDKATITAAFTTPDMVLRI